MPKCGFLYIILSAFIICTFVAAAQNAAPLPVRTLTVADGLPQSYISGLVQDEQGFVWIGTRDGLARFDGLEYKLFNHVPGDTNSLAANIITNLWYDHHNRLWIVYETGDIDILNTTTEILLHFNRQPAFKAITGRFKGSYGVVEDDNGNVWLPAKQGGVFIGNLEQHRLHFFSNDDLGVHHITGIARAGKNILLVTDTALITLNSNRQIIGVVPYRFERAHLFNAQKGWKNTRPLIRSNGDVVILDEDRLILYQAATGAFTTWPLPPLFKVYSTPCMAMDDRENIYFDINGTIYMLSPGNRLQVWQPKKSNRYNNIVCMLFDRSGILWLGGNGNGITLYDLRITHLNGTPYTNNFFADVLQRHAAIPMSDLQRTCLYNKNPYMVRHAGSRDSTIWFSLSAEETAFPSQLCYINKGRLYTMRFDYAVGSAGQHTGINALAFSKKGALWGIDYDCRLVRFNTNTKTVLVYPAFNSARGFHDLLVERETIFWVTSTNRGLFRYDMSTGELQNFQQTDRAGELPSGPLLDMENDPHNSTILWIGSMGGGLIRFDKTTGHSRCFTINDRLPNNTVYAIIPDGRGIFWCSSNKGLFTFNPRTNEVHSFTTKNGLLNDEFNRFHFLQLPNGHIAFGGVDNYTVFDPLAITEDNFQPHIVLTGLSINNEPADYGQAQSPFRQSLNSLQQITLPWHRNFLSFRFAALEYNIPEKLQYRYRLQV
jgi:streptogramin lyase